MNRQVGLVEAKRKAHQPSDWFLHHPIELKDAAASFGIVKIVVPQCVDDRDWDSVLRWEISTIQHDNQGKTYRARTHCRGPRIGVKQSDNIVMRERIRLLWKLPTVIDAILRLHARALYNS